MVATTFAVTPHGPTTEQHDGTKLTTNTKANKFGFVSFVAFVSSCQEAVGSSQHDAVHRAFAAE